MGDTVSTDLVDFTMDKAAFSYYASSVKNNTYTEPIEESSGGIFTTNKGHTFICMTFTMTNNDRSRLDVGGSFAGYKLKWNVDYKEQSYDIREFDLNNKDGRPDFGFVWSAISSDETRWEAYSSSNLIMDAGEKVTVKTLGQVNFEPQNLNDGFEITISLPNSSGGDEYFTYVVN